MSAAELARRTVLDACLLHPEQIAEASSTVNVADFDTPLDRATWRALLELKPDEAASYRSVLEATATRVAGELDRPVNAVVCDLMFCGLVDGEQVHTELGLEAAAVVGEHGRRRRLAARLAAAADAVAHRGADLHRVLDDLQLEEVV